MGASFDKGGRLVGRQVELARAAKAVEERSGAVFHGPPGHGKAALVRAAAGEAASRTAEVVRLRGTAGDPAIPFAAFAAVAPEIGARPGRLPESLHLLQSFRASVLRRAGGRRLVLAIEGAHLLDDASATLVNQLVTSGSARLLAAVDGPDAPPALESLWLEDWVDAIQVGPLDRETTLILAAAILDESTAPQAITGIAPGSGPPLSGELGQTLWRLSGGRPAYLRELLAGARRSGQVGPREGIWALLGPITAGPALATAVAAELRPAGQGVRILEALALAEDVPLGVLSSLYGVEAVSELERRGWIIVAEVSGRPRARVAHPLHAEVILAGLPASETADLASTLATSIEAAVDGPDQVDDADLVTVVRLRILNGGRETPERLVRAATAAGADQYWVLSAVLARHAVDLAGDGPISGAARLALANAMRAQGRAKEALAIVADLDGSNDDQKARIAVLRASAFFFGLGDHDAGRQALAAAQAAITDPNALVWLEAVDAGLAGFAGDPSETVDRATALLARPGLDARAELTIRFVLCMGLASAGRALQALEVTDGLLEQLGHLSFLSNWAVTARALAYRLAGRTSEAHEVASARYERALARDNRFVQACASGTLGWSAMERGELSRAVACFQEAAVAFRSADSTAIRVHTLHGLVEALAITGDPEGAAAALEEARVPAQRAGSLRPDWSVAAAWVSASKGLMSEAIERLTSAAEEARSLGQVAAEVQALHAAVRLGSQVPALRLADLAGEVEGTLVALAADHAKALGLGAGQGAALDDVSRLYSDSGLDLYSAEAAAQACHAHRIAGSARRASASAARYNFLLARGQDTPMPLAVAQALAPPGLTRREREVAMLAARGRPSPAIADELCLSVRTVETHLARVYAKLGISGRVELPTALTAPTGIGVEAG